MGKENEKPHWSRRRQPAPVLRWGEGLSEVREVRFCSWKGA